MKIVILCGGLGTRIKHAINDIPTPMITIGRYPILWHVMKIFACQGFTDFILCLGYKGAQIKSYFSKLLTKQNYKDWHIDFAYTGLKTPTGGRLKLVESLINTERFIVTYADGLSNIDISSLLSFHVKHKKIATVTSVHPQSNFGEMKLTNNALVTKFVEKPLLKSWVNGGFFVFEKSIVKILSKNDVSEKEALMCLAKNRQLTAYKHTRFWKCLDTYKDKYELNQIWKQGKAPWKIWKD